MTRSGVHWWTKDVVPIEVYERIAKNECVDTYRESREDSNRFSDFISRVPLDAITERLNAAMSTLANRARHLTEVHCVVHPSLMEKLSGRMHSQNTIGIHPGDEGQSFDRGMTYMGMRMVVEPGLRSCFELRSN